MQGSQTQTCVSPLLCQSHTSDINVAPLVQNRHNFCLDMPLVHLILALQITTIIKHQKQLWAARLTFAMLVNKRRQFDDMTAPALTTLPSVGLDLTNSSSLQARQTRSSGLPYSFEWDDRCDLLHKLSGRCGIQHKAFA